MAVSKEVVIQQWSSCICIVCSHCKLLNKPIGLVESSIVGPNLTHCRLQEIPRTVTQHLIVLGKQNLFSNVYLHQKYSVSITLIEQVSVDVSV